MQLGKVASKVGTPLPILTGLFGQTAIQTWQDRAADVDDEGDDEGSVKVEPFLMVPVDMHEDVEAVATLAHVCATLMEEGIDYVRRTSCIVTNATAKDLARILGADVRVESKDGNRWITLPAQPQREG